MIKNQKLLITGGTGSFGNAVLRRFLEESSFSEIRIFSRDEKKQDSMRQFYNSKKIKYFIGDVRDIQSLRGAINGVDLIFHAAALKQVPSCEFFPMEAVNTNVFGLENVLNASIEHNVKSVILLSTDKAVYPVNVMGMTKALSEKLMISRSKELNNLNIRFCATRYGNVMASRGSVIPLIINQIKSGKEITVTDPKMTRFMMSLDEAVELVWFAYKNSNNGDIFVQKSPSTTLNNLVNALKEIYDARNKIRLIGTRHGEKLYETLVNREEMSNAIEIDNYYRIPSDKRNLNYNMYFSKGDKEVTKYDDYNSHNSELLDKEKLIEILLKLPLIKKDINGENNPNYYEP